MHEDPMPYAPDDAVASHVCGACADSRHGPAHRVAVVKPPALRRMAVRVELLGLGTGLTARDKVSDAEPW